MTFLVSKRTLESYYEKIASKAKNTQKAAHNSLKNFDKFCQDQYQGKKIEEVLDELLAIRATNENAVFDIIQLWINWNKGKLVPTVIRTHFSHIKSYLYYRGVKLTSQDVRENLSFPKNLEEEPYPLQVEDVLRIFKVARYDKKALFLAQLSSGMRIGELVRLRKKHLDLSKKRIVVKIPAQITKTKRARTTFLSKEAEQLIRPKLSRIGDDDLVWGVSDDPYNAGVNEMNILNSYCKKVGLNEKYESTGRLKINTHSFRAFFVTKISRHDENFAKKLAGQKGYLLQYDRMTEEEKLERYLEFEHELVIFDDSRKIAEINKLKKENSDLELKNQRIDDLEKRLESFENEVKEDEEIARVAKELEKQDPEGTKIFHDELDKAIKRVRLLSLKRIKTQ